MTTPYCTTIDIAQGIRLDLLTPTAFRFRVSTLAGEPFPPKYEIPFALGRTRSWPEVPYQRRTDAFDLIETASLQIQIARDLSQGKKFLVHTPDGSRRIYPSDGSPRSSGMFRDGYTVFDSASALSEENNNSRYAHWFHNPESGRYDVFLPEDAILDTFFVYGPRYEQLFASINEIIGPEPLLPIAAYGFFQTQHLLCAGSQEKLLALAKRLREQHIPCDTLILDIEWGDGCDGESPVPLGHRLAWSPRYCSPLPPERMIEELKKRHFSVMLNHHSVPGFRDRNDRGWTGKVWDQSEWWREFHAKLDYGLGGPWMDTRQNDITDSIVWDGIQEHTGDRRVLFMGCRDMWETSGCAGTFKLVPSDQLIGSRRYPFDWTGDCAHTWEELRWQIRAITDTHGSMKAVTYITNDALAENHRLQARWNQFLSFNTIVRSHSQKPWQNCDPFTPGSNPESEPPGETAEESIRAHLELRYRLLPYLYSHAHQNYRTGLPICRPMLLAFPDDPQCNADQWPFQYLFGQSILAAPVYAEVESLDIYLPAGPRWIGYWDRTVYEGGRIIRFDTRDTNRLPLFIRSGSIIPMQEPREWIEPPARWDPLILEIYPDGESAFALFEDDGVSLGYQRGQQAVTALRCERVGGGPVRVHVRPIEGTYNGIQATRSCRLRVIGIDAGVRSVEVNGRNISTVGAAARRSPDTWRRLGSGDIEVDLSHALSRGCEVTVHPE